jgi:hypothetical protein
MNSFAPTRIWATPGVLWKWGVEWSDMLRSQVTPLSAAQKGSRPYIAARRGWIGA